MKKILGLVVILSLSVIGCLKNDPAPQCIPKSVESEVSAMTKFATDSSINYTTDASGLLYEVVDPGTGASPTLNSKIVAKYSLRFLTGELVEQGQFPEPYLLSGLIRGWQIGLPNIKEGGKIKMIVPSSLAYGCGAGVQMNQPLYFNVELIQVIN